MVSEARGVIRLAPEFSHPDTVLHLEEFSHLWVVYLFHKNQSSETEFKWSPTIQPPRIDAPKKVGVFASRSPHRPNPIGLSVVKLEKINIHASGGIEIEVSGVDILDGSPVIDLKPYLPYADIVSDATNGWIKNEINRYLVIFSEEALRVIEQESTKSLHLQKCDLKKLITEMLEWDPRPRSQREMAPVEDPLNQRKKFAFRLMDLDVHWIIDERDAQPCFKVISILIIPVV